jgi:hypothetical protein
MRMTDRPVPGLCGCDSLEPPVTLPGMAIMMQHQTDRTNHIVTNWVRSRRLAL